MERGGKGGRRWKMICPSTRMRRVCVAVLAFLGALQLLTSFMTGPDSPSKGRSDFLKVFPYREWSPRKEPLVLLWTRYYGVTMWWKAPENENPFANCPVSSCRLTTDKQDLKNSDAVLFHAWDQWNYFLGRPLPDFRLPHQVWMLASQEPNSQQPLDMSRYNGVFNWTIWYRRDADVTLPYGHVVPLTKSERAAQERQLAVTDFSRGKSKMAVFVASNCFDSARRRLVVNELSRFLPVDSFGKCSGRTLPCPWAEVCPDSLTSYKFYLAFENSICPDYVTEKFWYALRRGQVPVTLSKVNYEGVVPPGSYISVDDFPSVRELAAYLRYLDNNATAYNSYFRWRASWKMETDPRFLYCRVCEALHDRGRPAQVYADLGAWDRLAQAPGCELFSIRNYLLRIRDGLAISLGIR